MVRMGSNLQNSFKNYLGACCLILLGTFSSNLHGTSGTWNQTGSGNWNVGTNWTSNPVNNVFPNAAGDVAAFIGSLTVATTINSTANITIGALLIGEPSTNLAATVTIGFTNNTLRFDGGGNQVAKIVNMGRSQTNINTPVNLITSLEVFAPSVISFNRPISSANGKNELITSTSSAIMFTAQNTFPGTVIVNSGILQLVSPLGGSINGPLNIFPQATAAFNQSNQCTNIVDITSSGRLAFNGTPQSCNSLTLLPLGLVVDTVPPGTTFTLLESSPDPALTMSGRSSCFVSTLTLQNQGSIVYDSSLGIGQAEYGSTTLLSTINLGGTVNLGINSGEGILFDIRFRNVRFINGTLNVDGSLGTTMGSVCFDGNLGPAVSAINITNARVLAGLATPGLVIDVQPPGSTIAVQGGGILGGVATLGSNGSANVLNNFGTVAPGSADSPSNDHNFGILGISGDYTQGPAGTLEIKLGKVDLFNQTFDQLNVLDGDVILNGTLSLIATSRRDLHVGDQFIIIDNSTGTSPITGQFATVESFLPPELVADVQYNPQTVVVTLKARCP